MEVFVGLGKILRRIKEQHGFITDLELKHLAKQDRLRQCLVRCNNCRFLAAAQDVAHLVAIIDASNKDYVRDVSLPTTDPIWND